MNDPVGVLRYPPHPRIKEKVKCFFSKKESTLYYIEISNYNLFKTKKLYVHCSFEFQESVTIYGKHGIPKKVKLQTLQKLKW